MKRYRVFGVDFDSRPYILSMEIKDEWEETVKEGHRHNKEQQRQALLEEFGEYYAEQKKQNFIDLGSKPFSIIAFHNKFLEQVRNAFVVGSYYPALTGACALGERILNHLVLLLRDDFRNTPEYKRIHNKSSFDDWNKAIEILESWGVLLPEAATAYRHLRDIRNQTIHFKPEVDHNERQLALGAIHTLNTVINKQFGALGRQPWFIPDILGASFIKKEAEQWPFVKKVYLPNSYLVGPQYRMEFDAGRWLIHDVEYENREISDDEFRELLKVQH
ncbi:hypothetical protein SE17_04540 [Kouleothrix aurantiaca]|uniref:DUF4145 domain-containing protein n=1 Tax=Kouleothrix aurantiaca TaxID=186479 RepID=A0A0P9D5H1_9CHLR|nr:hypothetical protein SE17_04540 [Kouleothrix aurantiaca]